MANIDDLFSDPNGPAFEAEERRIGIPLDYVADKLRSCIESLHTAISRSPVPTMRENSGSESPANIALVAQRGAFMYAIVAFLALHNMLGVAKNPSELSERLCAHSRNDLRDWLDQIEHGGSIEG